LKILVDTCVWSLALRRRDQTRLSTSERETLAHLSEAILDNRAAIIGPIRQEILSGIRDQAQFTKTEHLLEPFLDEEVADSDYVAAARLFNLCQDHGVRCGPVDILLCAVAVRKQYSILTHGQGMERSIAVLKTEGLIQ
jgi:predicted nucleic acid-binding protein